MKNVRLDIAVFTVQDARLQVLLTRRPGNRWTLPGGPAADGCTLERGAHALLADEAGVGDLHLEQLYTFDRGGGDALTVGYLALISAERHPPTPGGAVVEVRWLPLDDLPELPEEDREILERAHRRLRDKSAYAPIAFQLLPETFTLGELQAVYEAVLDTPLDTRNFRRDVLAAGVVRPVGRTRAGGPGRPAQLYRSVDVDFSVDARERRIARSISTTTTAIREATT